jgi:glutamine amidotransferase
MPGWPNQAKPETHVAGQNRPIASCRATDTQGDRLQYRALAGSSPMIGIIDYGMGNLRSVQKALQRLGADAQILRAPAELDQVDKLILPGVGAFADGMANLRAGGWVEPIHRYVEAGGILLGVCLGMQLLFESSEEDAPSAEQPVEGLSLLPGRVVRFNEQRGGQRLKVPHMGWNQLTCPREDPLMLGVKDGRHVYFVHGYYVEPDETRHPITSASSDYGGPFTASIWRDNIWGTQFHPEKSQRVGLTILQNFVNLAAADATENADPVKR